MLLFDAIAKIKPGESFLEHPSTFKHYRTLYWDPNVFLQSNLGQWQEMGSKSFVQIANERAKRLLKEHEYEIEPEKKRELDKVYETAAKDEELAKERQY
jgi:trimethylamine:corrinoid methyltransferase-like protein